jgi:hypothetical protein
MRTMIKITVIASALLVGCADVGAPDRKDAPLAGTPPETASPAAVTTPRPAPPEGILHAPIDAPEGWRADVRGGWMTYTSPDGISRISEGALTPTDEVSARLKEIAALMDASDLHVSEEQPISIGPDQLPARAADGWCHVGRDEARVAYAVVDTGEGRRVMLVHLTAKDAAVETQRAALTVIASLRRR